MAVALPEWEVCILYASDVALMAAYTQFVFSATKVSETIVLFQYVSRGSQHAGVHAVKLHYIAPAILFDQR
jgi:hypothetical protein